MRSFGRLAFACLFLSGCPLSPRDQGSRGALQQAEEPLAPLPPSPELVGCLGSVRQMAGPAAGGCAQIVLQNKMSEAFALKAVHVAIDGSPVYQRAEPQGGDGALDRAKELDLFVGQIAPGDHELSVHLTFSGRGHGVFSYLNGYTFQVKSTHQLTMIPGHAVRLHVVAREQGGATTPLEERPSIRFAQDPSWPPPAPQ